MPLSSIVIFPPGSNPLSTECVTLSIVDDEILEVSEVLSLQLTTTNSDVIPNPSTTSVTILDDEAGIIPYHIPL